MIYNLTFKSGKIYQFEADRLDDDGRKLSLWLKDGSLVARYQDSDIAACEQLGEVAIASGEAHGRGGALLYDEAGATVASYRTEEAARAD